MRFIIQHHPAREVELTRLLESLAAPATIITDTAGKDAPVSAWRTYRRCLEAAGAESAVILQDDAVCCPGFASAAAVAHAVCPGQLVAFFHALAPRNTALAIIRASAPIIALPIYRWVPTVALLWPEGAAADCLRWANEVRRVPENFAADDSIIKLWLDQDWRSLAATSPSLVEHPDDSPSICRTRWVGGRRQRVAAFYTGHEAGPWIERVQSMA